MSQKVTLAMLIMCLTQKGADSNESTADPLTQKHSLNVRSVQKISTAKRQLVLQPVSMEQNGDVSSPLKSSTICVNPPSNSKMKRVYDKRNYCLFCSKPSSKIGRHLEIVHRDEIEVAKAFQYPKRSKERRQRLSVLRNQGNFAHNNRVVHTGTGQLVACYRPKQQRNGKHFSHCIHCQGLFSKKQCGSTWRTVPRNRKTLV